MSTKQGVSMKRFPFALAICIAALTASHSAQAETIFLKCGTTIFTVDLAKSTVNNAPANITPLEIDVHTVDQYADMHVRIDRTAGILRLSGVYLRADGNIPIPPHTENCAITRTPKTKF
jgi:hypothetical protein